MTMPSTKERAVALLKDTTWLSAASDDFINALAELMVPIDAKDGHIFVTEGHPIHSFMIVESGTLARTKLAVDEGQVESFRASIRSLRQSMVANALDKHSVLIDTIEGRGRITGLLHNFQEGAKAYATVTARGSVLVWMVSGDSFRDLLEANPPYMMECLVSLAHELRSGSKSLATLLRNIKGDHRGGKDDDKGERLRVLCYDATSWVTDSFKPAIETFNQESLECQLEFEFTTERLGPNSATYAAGYEAVCTFVNDTADADTMQTLSRLGVKMIAQRAAGFDRIDTKAARAYGLTVARVPAYSPYAVAEMAISLLLAVNRKIAKASMRVKMANFTLDAGLMGMDLYGKTIGVMGTGKIGQILCNIILGFGANLICYDVYQSDEVKKAGGKYVSKEEILTTSDVLFLMMPLLPATHHTINDETLKQLKPGVILINTSRGGLVNTKSLLKGLQSGKIAGCGMDVYENEQEYFFQDWSARHIKDPDLLALLGENNLVLTAHQAFFTKEAVDKIVSTTIENLRDFKKGMTGMSHPNNCIPPVEDPK